MRRLIPPAVLLVLPAVLLVLAVAALPAVSAVQPTGFAFGRLGGNIRPYAITIANSGVVRVTGPVSVGRKLLTPVQLATLNRIATETNFTMMPTATNCPGSLPDSATTYVRVAAHTVRVHGGCVPRYERLLKALKASVRLSG
jgi:hypothetical protein